MPPEFPSAAQIFEYVYLFSQMKVGSYGLREPHPCLVGRIPTRLCEDCRSTSERKRRTHTYDDLVHLLIELALERENDSHMEAFLKRLLREGANPTPERSKGKGPKTPANANKGGGKAEG